MKKLLLVTIFTLCLPLASYALNCPSVEALNTIISKTECLGAPTGHCLPETFKAAGLTWGNSSLQPNKATKIITFDAATIRNDQAQKIRCGYIPNKSMVVITHETSNTFTATTGPWRKQGKSFICADTNANNCKFKQN